MNILFLGTSFIGIYEDIIEYFQIRKFEINLYFVYYDINKIDSHYLDVYNPILLPNNIGLNDSKNIDFLLSYLSSCEIDIIVNPNIPINEISLLMKKVKQIFPCIRSIDLLHSCTNFVVLNKKIELKELRIRDVKSFKLLFQYFFPSIYLCLLQMIVRSRMKLSYSLFDRIVVLSQHYVKDYIDILNIKGTENRIVAIPNAKGKYENVMPIQEKQKQILFVGRLSKEKAVSRLLYIWKKVMDILPDWNMLIVGDGPEKNRLELLAIDLGLCRIEFCGFQDSIPYINKASILCLASNFEGFPLVFIEAMSLGTIPIGFDSFSAIHDMIDDGKNGCIIPAFDLDKYAEVLIMLAQEPQLRWEMAREAQMKVKRYEVANIASLWYNLFKELM